MHRHNLSATSIRKKVSFDLADLTDDSDPEDYRDDYKSDWSPRSAISGITPRRLRKYVIASLVFFVILYITFHRSHPPLGLSPYLNYDAIDWTQYAYTQYVTDETYLCNSVMVFEALDRLGSRADRILFYPKDWDLEVNFENDRLSQLLNLARDRYKVQLEPVTMDSLHQHESSMSFPVCTVLHAPQYHTMIFDLTIIRIQKTALRGTRVSTSYGLSEWQPTVASYRSIRTLLFSRTSTNCSSSHHLPLQCHERTGTPPKT